jgi:adenine-specific DNA-methyltransferase
MHPIWVCPYLLLYTSLQPLVGLLVGCVIAVRYAPFFMSESQVQPRITTNQEDKALQDMTPQELLQYAERLKIDYEKLAQKHVKYGLVWEDHDEEVVKECQDKLPVLQEISARFVQGAVKQIAPKTDVQLNLFEAKNDQDSEDIINLAPAIPTENINHILIEGDNYHALSVLNYTHKGKIDVIYIDPPYNTGNNDFIYNDRFVDKNDSFRHSKWISFMEKRLKLAKDLLKETGVIFISIDDNEVANLRLLCNRVLGKDNFIGKLIWRKKEGGGQTDKYFVTEHEYVLVYQCTDMFLWFDNKIEISLKGFNKTDENEEKFKTIKLEKWGSSAKREDRPTMHFPIESPNGNSIYPIAPDGTDGRWRVGETRMDYLIENNLIYWENKGHREVPYEKVYYSNELMKNIKSRSILYDIANTGDGTNQLKKIFREKDIFQNPKPLELIDFLLRNSVKNLGGFTILDFFAGSGTTAHAVMQINAEDGGNRQCILVTNNENKICEEVTYERCKRVIEGYTNLKGEPIQGLEGNNLRYFKTDFVDYTLNDDDMKFAITGKCTEMLCLRENVFTLNEESKSYKIFKEGKKTVAIFYDMYSSDLLKLRDVMNATEGEKVLYYFSLDNEPNEQAFSTWKDITIQPIPKKILDLYKQLFRSK